MQGRFIAAGCGPHEPAGVVVDDDGQVVVAALVGDLIDPDARFISGQRRHGREDIAEGWAVFFAPDGPSIRWRSSVVEVSESGDLALSRGPYRIVQTKDGQTTETWGRFNSTWRHDGERWQVLFDAGGDHGMTPTEEERRLIEQPEPCE